MKHFFELAGVAFVGEGLGLGKHASLRREVCRRSGTAEVP